MANIENFSYDNKIVRNFGLATIIWGIVGMTVGLIAALQLVWPALNFSEYITFGRIRPLHTNAAIFATDTFNIANLRQLMNDFGQVAARDLVAVGNIRNSG